MDKARRTIWVVVLELVFEFKCRVYVAECHAVTDDVKTISEIVEDGKIRLRKWRDGIMAANQDVGTGTGN